MDSHSLASGSFTDRKNCSVGQQATAAAMDRIEEKLDAIAEHPRKKEYYSTAEVAEMLGKRPYTVREWCRLRRIDARKRDVGRGDAEEWDISHEELERYRNHGLRPIPTKY